MLFFLLLEWNIATDTTTVYCLRLMGMLKGYLVYICLFISLTSYIFSYSLASSLFSPETLFQSEPFIQSLIGIQYIKCVSCSVHIRSLVTKNQRNKHQNELYLKLYVFDLAAAAEG